MAPNRRGAKPQEDNDASPHDYASSVITKEEVEARGSGTREGKDTYDASRPLRSELRVFFTGLMFLTRLPVPAWVDHHPAYLMRSMMWFPLIGAAVIRSCFHEDGLADSLDGFGGGWGREQILRIMKDSRVGTYALVGMALALQAKLAVLGTLGPARAAPALIAAHAASRWTALPLTYACTYLQDAEDAKRGLYNWFAASRRLLTPPRLAFATASTAALLLAVLPAAQATAVAVTVLLATVLSGYYGNLVIGGVVGDYLGATIAVTELVIYLVLAADWPAAAARWHPLAVLAAAAAVPVLYARRVIAAGGASC